MIQTSICMCNLAMYNNGNSDRSVWINLPISQAELNERLSDISLGEDEVVIVDHGYELTHNSYNDVYSLNNCLNEISNDMYGRSKEDLLALIDYCKEHDDIPISDIWEIFKEGDYQILNDVTNETDLAVAYMQLYSPELYRNLDGFSFESCFNYQQMGKELIRDCRWVLITELKTAIRRGI